MSVCAGCKAERLACSDSYVYVLDTVGELLVRLAVPSPSRQWHKVPGALNTIAGDDTCLLAFSYFLSLNLEIPRCNSLFLWFVCCSVIITVAAAAICCCRRRRCLQL